MDRGLDGQQVVWFEPPNVVTCCRTPVLSLMGTIAALPSDRWTNLSDISTSNSKAVWVGEGFSVFFISPVEDMFKGL